MSKGAGCLIATMAALGVFVGALTYVAAAILWPDRLTPGQETTAEVRPSAETVVVPTSTVAGRQERTSVVAEPVPAPWPDQPLTFTLEAYLARQPGEYAVAVRHLGSGASVDILTEKPFTAASVFKLLILASVFEAVERGDLDLHSELVIGEADAREPESKDGVEVGQMVTVEQALRAMITASSNNASYALVRVLGGWSPVIETATSLGLSGTTFGETITMTAADVRTVLLETATGRLVSPTASQRMLGVLLEQQNRDRLPALLPEQARVAHKTGELPGVRNDAGIVFAPAGSYVIVVLSQGVDEEAAVEVIAQISRMVHEHFAER